MATYTLTSPQTGREYDVEFDREPTQADVDGIWPQLDAHYATQEENKNVLFGVDTLSGIGQALGGLPTTANAAYYRMLEGDRRPDEYSPEARAAFDAANAYQARMQQESQDRIMRGEATSAGEAFREAAPSLGTSAISMGANIGGRLVGKGVGAVAGLIAGAPSGPAAVGTAGVGGALGETAAGMAASYYVTQRIAKSQFLDDAFRLLGEERAQKGQPWGEQEKQEAYQELLPLAEAAARWEAAPEALSNAITFGAGKYVLGIGKKTATDIARNVWKTLGKKTGAGVGSLAAEGATETVTQLGQAPLQAQAQAYAQGRPGWQQEQGPYARPGGTLQAAADVLPATVATQVLMLGMGAGVKGGASLLTSRRDAAATPAPGQPMSQTGQPMSQPSPLAGIAARGGRVDVPPLLPEDTGDFTAAEARALAPRQPILTNVPDRAPDNAPVSTQPPADQTAPDAVPTAPPTTTGPDVQTGTEMPVPPPTAAAGAGAGGISTPASPTPSTPPTAAAPAPAATPETGGVAESSAAVSPSETLTAAPAAVQPGELVTYEGYAGRLTDPAVRQRVTLGEMQRSARGVTVSEATFTPAAQGTTPALQDARGRTYVPHNPRLLRSVRQGPNGLEVLVRDTAEPGRIIKLVGPQALQAQDALIAAAAQVEAAGGKVNWGTQRAPGFRNLDTSGRTAGFLNTEILAEGAALIRRGVTDFTSWSRAMVQRFGAAIREFLAGIWQQITSPQTNAAQNVRLGMPQGTAPVTVGEGGFVASPFHKAGTPFQVENLTLRTFLTSSPLPANLRGALDVTENERRAVDQQVAMISRDLQAAMTNAQKRTGQSEAAILGLVEQAMTGQPGAMVMLRQMDANLGERTRRARNILDDLSTAVAATLPVGPLSKTILANRGEWMQRGYAAFDPQSDWSYDKLVEKAKAGQMVGGKDPAQILADARNYLRTQQPGITPAELEATMRDLMDRNTWQQALTTGTVRKQVGSLMQRKSIAPEIRALMGEETNVIHRLVKSASFQAQLIARHHGQVTMRTLGLATDLLRPQRGGVYTVQIPDEGYQWSGLGGLWTTPQLMEALRGTAGVLQEGSTLGGWLAKTLKALGNEAKLNRVALNPDSWLVNVLGGFMATVQSGDVFSWNFIKRLREAGRITGSSAARQNLSAQEALMDSYREMLTRLVSSGVVGSSITLADIEASIPRHLLQWVADNELRDRSVGMAQGAVIGQSMGRGLGLAGRAVGAALGGLGGAVAGAQNIQKWRQKVAEFVMTKPDNLFRVTGWLTNYESALAGGLTTDQAAEYASERTLNTFPNYNALPAPLREASKLGLMGSFIAFQHEVYRNFYWNVRYMAQELRSSNAAEQARGLRRLGGLVTIGSMTLGGGLAALLAGGGAVGADDERNRIYRRWFAAPWEKDAVLAFDTFTPETVSYFNTSYLLPQITMQELAQAAMESEAPDEAVQRIMGRLWEQFAAGSVNLSPILNAVANQDRSGRPITNREGVAGVADRVDSAMQTMLEPGVSDKLTRVIYAMREAKRRGRAFSVEEEVKRAFAVRAQTREWEPMIKGVYARFASRYRGVREDANRVLGENLPGAARRAVEEANTRITALQRELAEFELDLKRLPPTRKTILAAKKEAQMGNLNLVRVRKDGERVESVP